MWALGFDGTGVLVANIDTGVDGAHAALASRWRGAADPRYADNPEWAWLDPYAAEKIMSLFIQLANEFNTTVILASHAWRHVKELGLRRLDHKTQHLDDGKLTETVVSG